MLYKLMGMSERSKDGMELLVGRTIRKDKEMGKEPYFMDKPCPFCNGKELKMCMDKYDMEFVYCEICDCEGPRADSAEQATYLWLKRAEQG